MWGRIRLGLAWLAATLAVPAAILAMTCLNVRAPAPVLEIMLFLVSVYAAFGTIFGVPMAMIGRISRVVLVAAAVAGAVGLAIVGLLVILQLSSGLQWQQFLGMLAIPLTLVAMTVTSAAVFCILAAMPAWGGEWAWRRPPTQGDAIRFGVGAVIVLVGLVIVVFAVAVVVTRGTIPLPGSGWRPGAYPMALTPPAGTAFGFAPGQTRAAALANACARLRAHELTPMNVDCQAGAAPSASDDHLSFTVHAPPWRRPCLGVGGYWLLVDLRNDRVSAVGANCGEQAEPEETGGE